MRVDEVRTAQELARRRKQKQNEVTYITFVCGKFIIEKR